MRTHTLPAALLALLALSHPAIAQSLFHAPLPPPPKPDTQPADAPATNPDGTPAETQNPAQQPTAQAVATHASAQQGAPTLKQVGLFVVVPPTPRAYAVHDKIEVIINETTTSKIEQNLDTKESNDLKSELTQFPSMRSLLRDGTLLDGIGPNSPNIALKGSTNYNGDGTAERKDRLTARISGLVQEVKPNGLLLIEARESITNDREIKNLVLSGLIDPKDITRQNTVQSSQLANLVIKIENTGDVKDSATKNWLTRTLDAIFGI
jgi:flagellar L-ring protein precursor FlgH